MRTEGRPERVSVTHHSTSQTASATVPSLSLSVCVCVLDAFFVIGAQFLNNAVLVFTVYSKNEPAIYGRHNDSIECFSLICHSDLVSFLLSLPLKILGLEF